MTWGWHLSLHMKFSSFNILYIRKLEDLLCLDFIGQLIFEKNRKQVLDK